MINRFGRNANCKFKALKLKLAYWKEMESVSQLSLLKRKTNVWAFVNFCSGVVCKAKILGV